MEKIYFITGNAQKMQEARDIVSYLVQLDINLLEIQEIDPQEIIRHKLKEALKHCDGPVVVEDTSLHLECLGGLPGPFVKWFLASIGCGGLYDIAQKNNETTAQARAIVGYSNGRRTEYFEGVVDGHIVAPQGEKSFGWDPIFKPDGFEQTFAQMTIDQKNAISHRRQAFEKLKNFLEEM
ncbi:MAG: purine NTP pyrophosphatase [Candidatus Moraniibacteriota bacterium]|nr:MAG: purine NTP pyrophosphatase [Candidatus Moranbacteria bacterium]